ncbi:MAG TPA: hypothetical protein VFD58_24560 [Blastocatellia bacterium]|nr:hypothetical protein [Blastocatellia bacterium]
MNPFAQPQRTGSLLRDLPCEWFICGGWAIDLFLNRLTREHKDIDIAIARDDQFRARGFLGQRGWRLEKAINGELIPWADDQWLALPVHGVWCRNEGHDPDFIELLLNEIDDTQFRFRRDESITLPRERMSFRSASGLPVLAPEIVLLYKSNCREEDEADFGNAAGSLSEGSRVWLKAALRKLFAGHPWADKL